MRKYTSHSLKHRKINQFSFYIKDFFSSFRVSLMVIFLLLLIVLTMSAPERSTSCHPPYWCPETVTPPPPLMDPKGSPDSVLWSNQTTQLNPCGRDRVTEDGVEEDTRVQGGRSRGRQPEGGPQGMGRLGDTFYGPASPSFTPD